MKMYTLKTEQIINTNIDDAWSFFSSPRNLKTITPDYMDFKIKSIEADKPAYAGQIIYYSVKPLFNIPINWVTEITQVKHKSHFIDEQRFGPYKLWHHQHFFEEHPKGVKMTDIVHYVIPFGIIGRIANWLFISKQLEGIFQYRTEQVNKIFKKSKAKTIALY